jgi:hypothetical protein
MENNDLIERIEKLLEEMVEQQKTKVQKVGNILNPRVTREDILNPQDFPELKFDPQFNYEDGILSGIIAVQTAIRREKIKGTQRIL